MAIFCFIQIRNFFTVIGIKALHVKIKTIYQMSLLYVIDDNIHNKSQMHSIF
jgi:hypothetical protein